MARDAEGETCFVGFKRTPCVLAIEWVDRRMLRSWNRKTGVFQLGFHHLDILEYCRLPGFEATLLQLHVLTECVDCLGPHRKPRMRGHLLRNVFDTSVLTSPFRKQYSTATKKPWRKREERKKSQRSLKRSLEILKTFAFLDFETWRSVNGLMLNITWKDANS